MAYPIRLISRHRLVADLPRRRSLRSINLGGTVGTLMRQRFVTFSLFAEALCLYFSRATHFIWIYRLVLFVCNSHHVYLYHNVLIRVIFQKIRTTFIFLYKCEFSEKSRFTRNTHINCNELSLLEISKLSLLNLFFD